MQGAPDANALIGYGAIFTLFFITAVDMILLALRRLDVIHS